jgi:predicted transcriptional regulator YdeE
MEIFNCEKEAFSVIGKEGSTDDGAGFINRLWADATIHLNEVAALAKKDESGTLPGVWGLMSNFSRSFKPWEDGFTKGLYLAGAEVVDGAEAPDGWVKWTVPAFEYLCAKVEGAYQDTFSAVLKHLDDNGLKLAGAVFDYTCLEEDGQQYIFAPIRRL